MIRAHWRVHVQAPGVGSEPFLAAALAAVQRQSRTSASLAGAYYSNARLLELPGAPRVSLEIEQLPDEKVLAGLVAAGFQQLTDSLQAGHELDEALTIAGDRAAGSAVRNAMEPGRRAIKEASRQDSRVLGYYRITAGDTDVCYFCEALASRGAVYSKASFDLSDPRFTGEGSKVKVHDRCRCGFAPFFNDQPSLPEANQERFDQWKKATSPWTGDEKMRAWRRYWEALGRGETEDEALARAYRVSLPSGSIGTDEEVA